MTKVITITYDEQRDAIAAGFDRREQLPRLTEYENGVLRNGKWVLIDRKTGEEMECKGMMSILFDALIGFMERTKDT